MSSSKKRARVATESGITGASVFMVIVSAQVEVTEFGDEAFVHCYDDMAVEHTRQLYCEDIESKYSAPLARVFGTAEKAASAARETVLAELQKLGLAAGFNNRHQLVLRQDSGKELVLDVEQDGPDDMKIKVSDLPDEWTGEICRHFNKSWPDAIANVTVSIEAKVEKKGVEV
jgi:hypothetical protein